MRHLLRLVFFILFSFAAAGALPAAAQEAAPLSVAVVDIQKLQRESEAARTLRTQIETQHAADLAEIRRREDELRAAEQELARQKSVLQVDAWEERRAAFEHQVSELEQFVQERKRAIEVAYESAMEELNSTLLGIVAEMADERQLALILPKNQVVLAQTSLDLTDEVMARLNERLPQIDLGN